MINLRTETLAAFGAIFGVGTFFCIKIVVFENVHVYFPGSGNNGISTSQSGQPPKVDPGYRRVDPGHTDYAWNDYNTPYNKRPQSSTSPKKLAPKIEMNQNGVVDAYQPIGKGKPIPAPKKKSIDTAWYETGRDTGWFPTPTVEYIYAPKTIVR